MIKVMSFNIRYGTADDGKNHWGNRKPLVIERIKAFDPDLLGLQECRNDAQADYLKSHLPEYHFYGVQRDGNGSTALEMAPLLVKKASFEIVSESCFWLSETPHIPGSKSWDGMFARTATWTKLSHRGSGKVLLFLNTHFDLNAGAIQNASRLIRQWSEAVIPDHPLVITGDFNANKTSEAYQRLTRAGLLNDAFRIAHPDTGDEDTFHGFDEPGAGTPIDWILASSHFKVVDAAIDRTRTGALFPSDHYPVTASLEF